MLAAFVPIQHGSPPLPEECTFNAVLYAGPPFRIEKEGCWHHDPTRKTLLPCHIIHVITPESNRVFTVDEHPYPIPSLKPFRDEIVGAAREQAGNSGVHLSLAVAAV